MILKERGDLGKMIADGYTVCADDLIKFVIWNYRSRYTSDLDKATKWIRADIRRIHKDIKTNS